VSERLPDFLVIGAQKAGSTYLLNCLRDHPAIFMPHEEVSLCERGPLVGTERQRVASRLAEARPEQVVGIKRPNLLGTPNSARWLADAMPQARLIAILRNPIERAVSGYFHYMTTGLIPVQPLERGLTQILDGTFDAEFPRAAEVLTFGRYHEHLARFEQAFSRAQLLVLLLDDVKAAHMTVLSQLFRFLNVPADHVPRTVHQQPMQAPYSLTRLRLRRWLYGPTRQQIGGTAYLELRPGVVSRVRRAVARGFDQLVLRPLLPAAAPTLDADLHQRLVDYYRADIGQLGPWLGRSLDHWLQPQPLS